MKKLTKDSVVEFVAQKHNMTKVGAKQVVESVFDFVADQVCQQNSVAIAGFGTFSSVHSAARKGRNPQTGAEMMISAKNSPKFKAAINFKKNCN